jgi:Ca-activated chloride channel family protein
MTRAVAAGLALAAALATPSRAGEASLTIVDPAPDRYVSGAATLRARLEPEGLPVTRLTFTVDGQLVCSREDPPWECAWDAGRDVAAHHVRAVAVLADGRRLVDSVATMAAGFAPSVDVDVVQVAATVFDERGRLVKGLGPGDFRILEDGEPQELTHFVGSEGERELVVAVDMSGSMGPAMPTCREAVKRFLASLRPIDHVTVLAFNEAVFTVARRESAPERRIQAVGRLRAWGSTALFDAVLRGLSLLEAHRGRRALVLFTDGEDQISHATAADVEKRVEVNATPVYVIAQGKGTRDSALKNVLDHMAGVSGGRAFYTDRIDELDGVFAEIGEDLGSQYLLAYAPTRPGEDGDWRTIQVETPGRKCSVRARQGYRVLARGR